MNSNETTPLGGKEKTESAMQEGLGGGTRRAPGAEGMPPGVAEASAKSEVGSVDENAGTRHGEENED